MNIKKDQPINVDYLKYVNNYMVTFSKYLSLESPDAKMFQYALRFLVNPENKFDMKQKFSDVIECISSKIKLLEDNNTGILEATDVDTMLIRSLEFANDTFACWGNRFNYQYLLK